MADSSVSDFACLINQQTHLMEELMVCLAKLDSLVILGKNSDLFELKPKVINDYIWIIEDYIHQAVKFNNDALELLLTGSVKRSLEGVFCGVNM